MKKTLFIAVGALLISLCASAQNKVEVNRDYTQDISKIKKSYGIKLSDTIATSPVSVNYTIFDKKLQNVYGFSPLPSSSLAGKMKADYPQMIFSGTLAYPLGFNGALFYQPDIFKGEASENNSLTFSLSTFNVKDKRKFLAYDYGTYVNGDFMKSGKIHTNGDGYKGLDINNTHEANINYTHSWDWGDLDADVFAKSIYSTYYGLNYTDCAFVGGSYDVFNYLQHRKFVKNNASHNFSNVGFNLNFKNTLLENTEFLYNINLTYSNSKDKARLAGPVYTWTDPVEHNTFKLNENYLKLDVEAGPTIGKYSMVTLGVTSESAFTTGWQKFNVSLLDFTLQYQLQYKGWAFNLGAKASLNFNNSKGWDHYHTYIMPKADVSYALSEGRLWVYGSVEGNNYLNNYSSLMEITNWIYPGTTMREGSVPFMAKGGFKGFLAKDLTFDVSGGYAKHKGLLQFHTVKGPTLLSPLDADYTSNNEIFMLGELAYNPEGLKIELTTKFSQFSKYTTLLEHNVNPDIYREEYPIGKPKFEGNLLFEFNERERIFFGINAYVRSKAIMFHYHAFEQPESRTVPYYAKGYVNLSVYGKYVINNNFTAFAQVGNILNAKIQHYGMYLERGINVGAGVLIKF